MADQHQRRDDDVVRHVQLTAADFTGDAKFLSWPPKLRGIYCSVIFHLYQNNGAMDEDLNELRAICGWRGGGFEKAWQTVRPKFEVRRQKVRHKRVTEELDRAKANMRAHREAGVKGARVRWHGHSAANGGAVAGEGKGGKEKEEAAVWDGRKFVISEAFADECMAWWPNVTRRGIEMEVGSAGEWYADKGKTPKRPKQCLKNWLKKTYGEPSDPVAVRQAPTEADKVWERGMADA